MDIDNVIAGMQIIAKHTKDKCCLAAARGQIFCGSSDLPLTDAETHEMRRLGWFVSHDGSWMCWV